MAVEKSCPSRTASENAVICRVVPISSAIDRKPFHRIDRVIGLMGALGIALVSTLRLIFYASDDRPYRLDHSERPRALQEAVDGRQRAGASEQQDVPGAAILQRVEDQHCRQGQQAE